jgi:DNA-binding IclR family transcriptional regulator
MSQTISRAIEMIELVAAEPRSLGALAERFDVHKSTILRQLQTLEKMGFVLRRKDGRYSAGARLIATAQLALESLDLREVAHDELKALHEKVGNTIHLAQLVETTIVYVDKVEGSNGVRMYSRIGKTVPPYCTGVGKVILAQLPEKRVDTILKDVEWKVYTERTIADRPSLDAELDIIRAQGWGVDDGEFEDFGNCIAVPIVDSSGTIFGALSVTAVKMIKSVHALQKDLPEILATAREISSQLG